MMSFVSFFNSFNHPRRIFIIDSIGALFTFVTTFFLADQFSDYIGLPKQHLKSLSFLALTFSVYSFCCYRFVQPIKSWHLQLIATLNGMYILLSFLLILLFVQNVSPLFLGYFGFETIILLFLIRVEWKLSRRVLTGTQN